jgi:hypothetical protein
MAYTSDKKSTDLDALTAIANDDVLIVGDYDDSGIAKKITKTNFRTTFDATSSVKGFVTLSTAPASATAPIAVGDNDARIPTTGENDALAGTSGTPSSTNKYVTNDDTGETGNAKVIRTKVTGVLDSAIIPTLTTYVNVFGNGTTTYDVSTASGTQTIAHGLGVAPRKVKLTAWLITSGMTNHSVGCWSGTTNTCVSVFMDEGGGSSVTDTLFTSATYAIGLANDDAVSPFASNADAAKGAVSVDATNITITWTKTFSPTGTATIMWEAEN